VADSEPFEGDGIGMHQIAGAANHLPCSIDQQEMPAAFVTRHLKRTVFVQFTGLDGAILEVNAAAEALHGRKVFAM
jgi:hypothetical protein